MIAHDLADARESLAYWEGRAGRLPRYAIRRRREAREMTVRWRARVAEAERAHYGRGLLGALLLVACERRLPTTAAHGGRTLARRAARIATVAAVALVALVVAGLAAAVEIVVTLVGAVA
jgi:hypothetical protein